jgi:uncharacterized Zn finger protein (UPF0148 family)
MINEIKIKKYGDRPCPICNTPMFEKREDSYAICPICNWEDDGLQIAYPNMSGANHMTLNEARKVWKEGKPIRYQTTILFLII